MADKASSPMDDDIVKLRARVKELETELDRKEKDLETELNRRDRYRDAKDDLRSKAGDRDRDRDRDHDRDRDRDSDRDRDGDTSSSRRVANSVGDVGRSKRDAADRMVRGVTLGSVEAIRGFADAISFFAGNVIRRNESRDDDDGRSGRDRDERSGRDRDGQSDRDRDGRSGRDRDGRSSVRDMATRLPEDIATSLADTVDRFVDIPRRAADRYSQVHRQGEKDRDDRPRRTSDRDSTTHRDNDKDKDSEFRANVSVKT